jgi:hypothetical protein
VLALVFGCFVPGSLFLDPRFGHVVEREFRAFCFGRFVPGSLFLGVSWASLILVFGFLSGRPLRGRQWLVLAMSRELWGQVF